MFIESNMRSMVVVPTRFSHEPDTAMNEYADWRNESRAVRMSMVTDVLYGQEGKNIESELVRAYARTAIATRPVDTAATGTESRAHKKSSNPAKKEKDGDMEEDRKGGDDSRKSPRIEGVAPELALSSAGNRDG